MFFVSFCVGRVCAVARDRDAGICVRRVCAGTALQIYHGIIRNPAQNRGVKPAGKIHRNALEITAPNYIDIL